MKGRFRCVTFRSEGCGIELVLSTEFLVGVRVPKVNLEFWGRILLDNSSRNGLVVK